MHSWLGHASELVTQWGVSGTRRCLDLRPADAYRKVHLVPSTSIPIDTLEERFGQLPPKSPQNSFLIVAFQGALFNGQPVADVLESRGWTIDGVIDIFSSTEEAKFWEYVRKLGLSGVGNEGKELLFKPSPVLDKWISAVERDHCFDEGEKCVLDIGCGSGRDLGFLAARLFKWRVSGLDIWGKALRRTEIMINSIDSTRLDQLVHAKVDEDTGDIIALSSLEERQLQRIRDEKCHLILVIRFFPRQLFAHLHEFMKDDGYLIFSHFTNPIDGTDYDSPPREKRTTPGEIESILRKNDPRWTIRSTECTESEDGRPMWNIIAKLDSNNSV